MNILTFKAISKYINPKNKQGELMTEILLALFAGAVVGILFSLIKLPLPAPPVLSGIAGIFGIYLGGMAYSWIIERFFS